jgi:hypothetical protein
MRIPGVGAVRFGGGLALAADANKPDGTAAVDSTLFALGGAGGAL